MYRRILVPLDGSDRAERAGATAELVAARSEGARIHLAHVLRDLPDYALKMPQDDLAWEERAGEAAREYLDGVLDAMEERGVAGGTAAVLEGGVVEALDRYREEEQIDLVVMTTHGEGGFRRWWLGSVADKLVRRLPVPLLLLRAGENGATEEAPEPFRHVLVPLDGSSEAETVLPHARTLASGFGARTTLLQVIPPGLGLGRFRADPAASMRKGLTEDARDEAFRYLEEVARRLRESSEGALEVDHEAVADEQPADGILDRIRDGVDLVALATHGRGGFARAVLGSVADRVLRGSPVPVLIVRARLEEE